MKRLALLLFLLINSCSTLEVYQIGEYQVHITGHSQVNEEYQKVCLFNCERKVNGFVDFHNKKVWSTPDRTVLLHEMKHIVEGQFHDKHAKLD